MNKCRACKSSDLYKFLDLGMHPPSDQFLTKNQLTESIVYYPLDVYMCNNCGLAQLGYIVEPEILYQENYPYESSTTQTGKKHYIEFSKSVVDEFKVKSDELVIDIGSNVGVLLEGFKNNGAKVLGVDPAPNICKIANESGIHTLNTFFNYETAAKIVKEHGEATIITGTNVFAHIDDWDSLVKGVEILLKKNRGVFIIESPHFLHLISHLEYDTIYHEHLSYIAIEPLVPFFGKFNMEIIKVEQKDIHGGSIRIFVSKKDNYKIHSSVSEIIKLEKDYKIRDKKTLDDFALRVKENKIELTNLLFNLKNQGKRIVGVSAPAKGMTLLNYCKIDKELLDYVSEKSKLKIGLYTPGANIPVYPDQKLIDENPDYALLLAWNFSKEIMNNLAKFKKKGGKFIIPIPKPKIV